MPDISQTEVGRRLYHIHREKRVEQAIKKIQHSLGSEWKSIPEQDVHLLERLLADVWTTIEQTTWEKIPFAHVTRDDIQHILAIGKGIGLDKTIDRTAVENAKKIFLALT